MMKEYEWRTGRSCVFLNNIHLVFVTKYRRNVITKEMLDRMKELIHETCLQMDSELIDFNGEDDHVHMLVTLHPKWSISNFAGKLKGKTSYFLRKEFWNEIKNKLWGNHFWSPSYCAVSCGGAPLEIIKKYIENQRAPTSARSIKQSIAITKRKIPGSPKKNNSTTKTF